MAASRRDDLVSGAQGAIPAIGAAAAEQCQGASVGG
jgi:hypothetical protein